MRGRDRQRGHLGGYVDPEARVPQDHPLRQIRPLVDAALTRLSPRFDELYSPIGRPSIPPEYLLRASLLQAVLADPQVRPLLSDEHFSVDGTLIEAWASMKSFRRKDGSDEPPGPGRNGERNFRKEKRSNKTHASTTDPDARLARKSDGQEAKLAYAGHLLMENRHGLIVDARL